MYTATTLGFGPDFADQLRDDEDVVVARIAAEHRGAYEVWSEAGDGVAKLAGRLRRTLQAKELPGVGDWVVLSAAPGPDRKVMVERVLQRRTVFLRGAAGRRNRSQVVAANVDIVFAVSGLDADYNIKRIERYLARIWASGAQPEIVLNKADLCGEVALRVAEVEARCPGAAVHVTSALQSEGIEALRSLVGPGVTAAFVGSSGAGKSSLVNRLIGEDRMATGAIRESDGRGCHVTSHRQLVLLPQGGLVLDTPGMRELQLSDDEGLAEVFAEVAQFSEQCRFRDCRHEREPGCAVRQAVSSGELSAERFEHYLKLVDEAAAFETRGNEHERRKSDRALSQMYSEVGRFSRWKRGQ